MWDVLRLRGAESFDLVEAGAGNGRLARDVMDAAAAHSPEFYRHIRLTLVERSAAARAAQPASLGPHMAGRPSLRDTLPPASNGVIFANELLDALPVHVVTRTTRAGERSWSMRTAASWSSRAGRSHCRRFRSTCAPRRSKSPMGARVEVGLAASEWMLAAARTLQQGFLLLFDYGHEPGAPPIRLYIRAER